MTDNTDSETADSTTNERDGRQYDPDETVTECVELPSALWDRVVMNQPDSLSMPEWLHRLVSLQASELDSRYYSSIEKEISIDAETWKAIRLKALYMLQVGEKDIERAYWDAVNQFIEVKYQLVVDGEPVGPAALGEGSAGLEESDGDA